jgi:uncharacterized SAM-binding protein YcdF (DUF218 family)
MARRAPSHLGRVFAGIAGTGVLLAAGWVAGFVWFVATLPEQPAEPGRPTDAIVVLTGGSDRVNAGLDLLAAGHAERLLISGVHRDVDLDAVLRANGRDHGEIACCVDLGHAARTTRGNAAEAASWAARNDVRSLRLVTAAYHIPRSLLVFRQRLPDATVVPHPVRPSSLDAAPWWGSPATARLFATEYTKYLAALARETLRSLTGAARR